ncbi:hypothetical protein AB0E09_55130, partial [Streptomyces mirabilis]
VRMPTDHEYRVAAENLPAEQWHDAEMRPLLPARRAEWNNIKVGVHVHNATHRRDGVATVGTLGPEMKNFLERKRFGSYLLAYGHRWVLSADTPKKDVSVEMYSGAQYKAAAEALAKHEWYHNGQLVLPRWSSKADGVPVGRWLHDTARRRENGAPKATLDREMKEFLEGKGFKKYLLPYGKGGDAYVLRGDTPRRDSGRAEDPDRLSRYAADDWAADREWVMAPGAPTAPGSSVGLSFAPQSSQAAAEDVRGPRVPHGNVVDWDAYQDRSSAFTPTVPDDLRTSSVAAASWEATQQWRKAPGAPAAPPGSASRPAPQQPTQQPPGPQRRGKR